MNSLDRSKMDDSIYLKYLDIFKSQVGIENQKTRIGRKSDWVTVRIFISSTFKDQLIERYVLKTQVIPELVLWGRSRSIEIVIIDMTWGILPNSTAEHTVNICLSEIDRCFQTNGTPFFLYHGGQRYGWSPSLHDVGDQLTQKYNLIEGASVTAHEVLHGSLRSNNPNSIFCLRDESFLQSIPHHLLDDFKEKKGSVAEACQQALIDTIISSVDNIIYYNPKPPNASDYEGNCFSSSGCDTFGGDWNDFAIRVTSSLKNLIELQYPVDLNVNHSVGTFEAMTKQQSLYVDSLLQHIVPRTDIVKNIKKSVYKAAEGIGGRLITIAAESGRGKSSLVAELVESLKADGIMVVCHFIGPSEKSDEISTIATRIIIELSKCWNRQLETLPDDIDEICSLCRQTITLGPIDKSDSNKVVLITDALNQLNEDDPIKKLAWLPSQEDINMISSQLVIVTSCTPGEEYDYLKTLHGPNDETIFEIKPLNDKEKLDITLSLLKRGGKSFTDDQMISFLNKKPATDSPLWIQIAMSYLKQHARFETLSKMIDSIPCNVEELINLLLSITEKEVNVYLVKSLLLTCVLARQGLKESEALILVPEVAMLLYSIEDSSAYSDGKDSFQFDVNIWSHLRAALDVFLLHFMMGAPVILTPSHSIVREAILARYASNDERVVKAVRTKIGQFFERDLPVIDVSRSYTEASWAYMKNGDHQSLSRLLTTASIMTYSWYHGDRGQWDLVTLWAVVDELHKTDNTSVKDDSDIVKDDSDIVEDDSDIVKDDSESVKCLIAWSSRLCETLVVHDEESVNRIDDDVYLVLKAIFELLKMQRREHNAIVFLEKMETIIDLHSHNDSLKKQIMIAWIHVSLADCYYSQGLYETALSAYQKSCIEFNEIETLSPDPIIAECYMSIGKIHDAEKRLDDSLSAFEEARSIFTAVSNRSHKRLPIIEKLLGESKRFNGSLYQADILKEIANVWFSKEDYDQAESFYLKSLSICKKIMGDTHPKTARAIWGVAICERGKGLIDQSIKTHLDVAEIFTKCLGKNHPDTADMEYNIAFLYADKGAYDTALVHFYNALNVYQKCHGLNHRHVGWTYHDIGDTYMKAGRFQEAIETFNLSLSIRLAALGADSDETIETKESLDKALSAALENTKVDA